MNDQSGVQKALQNHQTYLSGRHDFQTDIELLAKSDLIKTVLETIMFATGMRFAAVARVTDDRWVACRTIDEVNFGVAEGDEIAIHSTFCTSVKQSGEKVVFANAATDALYRHHPIATKFGIVSYASIPVYRQDGTFYGTLCAIDTEPRDISNTRVISMLEMFADVISKSLETEEHLAERELLVKKEKELARLQQEFVAILGHDLRNPVAAIDAGLRQLIKDDLSERGMTILALLRSSLRRIHELVENIMLHAKFRLGEGIQIEAVEEAPLYETLSHVIEEVKLTAPELDLVLKWDLDEPITIDHVRLGQAVSNLISNAISHGKPNTPIEVSVAANLDAICIAVSNLGDPIPIQTQKSLFQPYLRGKDAHSEGLGLGLFIVKSIAEAHDGDVNVVCNEGKTIFSIEVPIIK